MKFKILTISTICFGQILFGQSTTANNIQGGSQTKYIGYSNNFPLLIKTNNTLRAMYTVNNSLTSLYGNSGDGLRIVANGGGNGHLDLFTTGNAGGNETHIVFGPNGQISGQALRFEFRSKINEGFYFNNELGSGMYKFATTNLVHAFVGTNKYWRIGFQAQNANISAKRQLEVYHKGPEPQFRITNNPNSFTFVDFKSRSSGNLNVLPSGGRVGINHNQNPTHTLDINGRLRIRQTPIANNPQSLLIGQQYGNNPNSRVVRRLDFTGNANDVLQGDGTWGPKGGYDCWDLNQNGINDPNEDVNGDGVWNGLDCGTDDQIITNFAINGNTLTLTIENGNTVNVDLSQFLDNTDDQNLTSAVLDPNTNILTISIENGNPVSVDLSGLVGTTNITADNGLTLTNNNAQWGQVNTNGASLNGGELIHHTEVPMNNYNVLFSGVGTDYTNTLSIGGVNSTRAKFNVYDNKKRIGIYTKIDDSQLTIPTHIVGLKTDVTTTNHFVYGTETTVDASGYTGGSPNYGELINVISGPSWNIGSYININGQAYSPQNYGQKIAVYSSAGGNTGAQFVVTGGNSNNGLEIKVQDNNANVNKGVVANIDGGSQSNLGLRGNVLNATGSIYNIGVSGLVSVNSNNNSNLNAAGYFNISQNNTLSNTLYGIRTNAYHGDNQSKTYGINSEASGLGDVYAGWFFGQAPYGSANLLYGIYAKTIGTGTNGTWAGYFEGNLHATGQVSSTNGTIIASDQMFKTNINNLTNSLDLLNQLQPKTFYYDTTSYDDFNFETDQQMGLIAQDVEQVLPTLVTNLTRPEQFDTLGNSIAPQIDYKGVEYGELIPLLIGGIQEQQVMITTQDSIINTQDSLITNLNDRLTSLENCLSNLLPLLCQINNNMIQQNDDETQRQLNNVLNIELNDSRNIVLNQNVPNPFAEQTTISFNIPSTVNQAQIHFYDEKGNLIKTVELTERGNGQINVFASDLSTGTYTYTLVADGQIVATKRMVKVN